ncbi:Ig-like domain-containing protein [Rhodococcus sp. OK519]|uniref:beta strand repeat-containing protein n=1 Tax=Rhodococcus sp. OK519 TaxID=2135729 RepID=UPI00215931C1
MAGVMLVGAPANAVTTTTNFTSACVAGSLIGDQDQNVGASMTVDAPSQVGPGEVFTYRIQPNASSYPDKQSGATTTNLSRLKYDYELPDNTEWVSGAVVSGTAIGLDNVAPNVLLVNDSGQPDANGRVIRLSGNNQTIGNGPSTSQNSEGGIRVPKSKKNLDGSTNGNGETWFRLPAVDVTVKALNAGVVTPRVRIKGNAANHGAQESFSTSLAKASFLGTQWAPTRCTPRDTKTAPLNAGAGPLATINVAAAQASTTTTLSAPANAETGAQVTLTATVAPSNASGTVQFKDGANDIGSAVAVSGGAASLNHTFTSAGSHSVTAVFTATGSFTGSTSAASTVTVSDPTPVDVATTLGLTVPQNAETGTAVDLTADVTPSNAQGTVQFKDGGDNIGTPVTVAAGAATLSHSFSAAGSHAITAEFTGAPGFTGSTAGAQTVNVTVPVVPDVETATSVSVPPSAATGASVTLTANVTPATATGTVQFTENGNNIGSPAAVSNGVATLQHTFQAAGVQAIGAAFTGDAGFAASVASQTQNVTVTDPDVASTTSLTVPQNAETGTAVDLTANVSPTGATGTVQFQDNGTDIGNAVAVSNGVATLSHAFTAAGSHSITATFSGGAGFAGSSAAAQTVTVTDPIVQDAETTTTVSVPTTAETGTSVTLSAAVAPAPTGGTVQFKVAGSNVGTAVNVDGAGHASMPYTFNATGAYDVSAVYSGTGGFATSTASAQSVTVSDPAPSDVETTLGVTVSATAETGADIDLTATVNPANAQGTVQFSVDGSPVGAPVAVSGGTATLSHAFASAGAKSVTAAFTGATGFANSTAGAQSVTVSDPVVPDTQTATTVSVPATAESGDSVTLSATVAPVPTGGTVQFKVAGANVGAAVNVDSSGHATMPYTFDAAGSYAVTAEFSGTAGFAASSASAQTVAVSDPAPQDVETALGLQVPATAETGVAADLTVTVTPSNAAGTVQFSVNGSPIEAPVTVSGGVATLSHTFATAGAKSVTAAFTGAAGFANSTATAQTVTVSDPTPIDVVTTTMLSVPGNAKTGEAEDLYATVYNSTTSEVVPSGGTVEFFDGATSLGTAPVIDGLATLSHTFTTTGTHTITATFSGTTGFAGSTATAKQVSVTVPTPVDVQTATVLTVPANAATGTAVELSAQVTGAGNVPVSGTVQFFDGATPIGDAIQVVNGTAVLSHTFTTAGAHSVHVVFSGGQGVADSTSGSQTIQVSGGSSGGIFGSLSGILGGLLGNLNFGS